MELAEIRTQGIGSNFTVLDPQDGFRKDNTIWFGNCSVCGERVSQSYLNKGWTHTVSTGDHSSRQVDYCPTA